MKSDVTRCSARPWPAAPDAPGRSDPPAGRETPAPAALPNPPPALVPEPPPDPALIPTPQHVLDAHLNYHRGRTAKTAREPLLPDEHQLGTYSVVCGLLVCIPFAAGFAAVSMGLLAVASPSKRADGDQVLGAFGILVGAINFTYWLWGLL